MVVVLLLLILPFCFMIASFVYLSVCYCYDVMVGEDSEDRCCDFGMLLFYLSCIGCLVPSLSPFFVALFCCFCRSDGPGVQRDQTDQFLPRVCPCCLKDQFACYWPWCGHQDYITVDCPCFCCFSDPTVCPQTATPVVTIQPQSAADANAQPDSTAGIFTVTTQSDA